MDIDRFIAGNAATWRRLETLVERSTRNRLAPEELGELVRLYQRASTHLSMARTRFEDPALTASLTRLVGRASAVIYGTRPRTWRAAVRFVTDTFPAALWHLRLFTGVSALLFVVPAAAMGLWLANSPAALDVAAPEALREAYVNEDFASYYSSQPSAQFATSVTTNNVQVGILAFAVGVLLCLPTAAVLAYNGANLGVAAGLFAAASQQPRFWGLILPHGLLELTAVFIAGATGLALGWSLVDPGDRPRGEALAEQGRRAIVVVMGLVGVFAVAGVIEGFVTGSPLPTTARVGIGLLAETVFGIYAVVRGRAAAARGLTGAIGEDAEIGWSAVTAPPST